MTHDFSKHTFRCSELGYLMSDPKGKSNLERYNEALNSYQEGVSKYQLMNKDTKTADNLLVKLDKYSQTMERYEKIKEVPNLSQTCKSKLSEIFTTVTTGRTKDIKAKYLEKGLQLEEDAITAYCNFVNEFHKKNKERRYNQFLEGELDFVNEDYVHDTKVSWDVFSFDSNQFKPINPVYEWQLEGYMWLWGKKKARLIYTLLDTPEHLIISEQKKLLYDFIGSEEDYNEACDEIRKNHTYSDLPLERKIKIFETQQSEERLERIKIRVEECRNFLNNISTVQTNLTDEEEY